MKTLNQVRDELFPCNLVNANHLDSIDRIKNYNRAEGWDACLEHLSKNESDYENRLALEEYTVNTFEAKETEIQQLKKRISWLESGSIHTCHAECEKPLCVANREIDKLKVGLDNTLKCAEHVENQRKHLKQALDIAIDVMRSAEEDLEDQKWHDAHIKISNGFQKINTLTEGK